MAVPVPGPIPGPMAVPIPGPVPGPVPASVPPVCYSMSGSANGACCRRAKRSMACEAMLW